MLKVVNSASAFVAVSLIETQDQAHNCARDLSRSLHPDWMFDLPRRAHGRVSKSGAVVVSGVAVLRGHHPHHRWIRGLCTRF